MPKKTNNQTHHNIRVHSRNKARFDNLLAFIKKRDELICTQDALIGHLIDNFLETHPEFKNLLKEINNLFKILEEP